MPGSIGGRSAKSTSFSEGASSRRQATKSLGGEATTADNAERARRGGPKKKLDAARLNALADEFEAFFGELQSDVYAEYTEGEDRLVAVERYVQRLERSLVTEQSRRIEMLKYVETNLQQQFDAFVHRNGVHLEALYPKVTERIVPWHARLAANEEAVVEERIARAKVIERERLKLIKILDDFDARLAIEKAERLEREALVLQKVSDESFKVQEEQADERNRREATLGHLRDETDAIDAMRDKPDALFKDGLMSRMVAATKNIKLETSQRVAAEQQFVASLTSYTEALQSGLRMVNKSVAGGSVPPARIVR